ncbi:MAG: hypothetical protein LBQ14_07585 [Treponema sp.]|jgi:hypothetical protein|nr:hypothetical protein [Treponema sp.]
MKGRRGLVFALLLISLGGQIRAQTKEILPSTEFDTSEFPLWAKDLRRAEIVAFGSLPFTMFFTTFAMDTFRFANNGANFRYAPWPFKSAGAVDMNSQERTQTIITAAAASVVIALVDYLIVRHKRSKAEEASAGMSPGDPIIIRKPWPERGPAVPEPPAGEAESSPVD